MGIEFSATSDRCAASVSGAGSAPVWGCHILPQASASCLRPLHEKGPAAAAIAVSCSGIGLCLPWKCAGQLALCSALLLLFSLPCLFHDCFLQNMHQMFPASLLHTDSFQILPPRAACVHMAVDQVTFIVDCCDVPWRQRPLQIMTVSVLLALVRCQHQ